MEKTISDDLAMIIVISVTCKKAPDGGIICADFVFDGALENRDDGVKLDNPTRLANNPTSLFETQLCSNFIQPPIKISPNPVQEQAVVKFGGLFTRNYLLLESYHCGKCV